jgi:hypothetical protein
MEQMTDAEINLAIAKIEFVGKELSQCGDHVDVRLVAGEYTCVDYVKSWYDIGTIIEREGIDLSYDSFEWSAYGILTDGTCTSADAKTPTKAAALCFLKMRESE